MRCLPGAAAAVGVTLLMIVAGGVAAAAPTDDDSGIEPFASAVGGLPIADLRRIAVIAWDDPGPATARAREAVGRVLRRAGHDVDEKTLVAIFGATPDRSLVRDLCQSRDLDGMALVRLSAIGSGGEESTLSVSFHHRLGARRHLFQAVVAITPDPPPPVELPSPEARRIPLSALMLEGGPFYDAIGRSDLADRYRLRLAIKVSLRVIGGVSMAVGIAWGVADLMLTGFQNFISGVLCIGSEEPCYHEKKASDVPWAIAGVGLGMLVLPAFVPTDPLTPEEKYNLVVGRGVSGEGPVAAPRTGAPRFTFGGSPVAGGHGAELFVAGRF